MKGKKHGVVYKDDTLTDYCDTDSGKMCRVTFLHPDLGIGGAERLIVDAALGLRKKGHSVSIVTTHHDPNRCFEETANGDLSVVVVGSWIPRSVFNRFYALMACIRMIYAAFFILLSGERPDVVICDLVSVAVPILKIKLKNVIFYCHYPDQLLSQPEGFLKRLYRIPLDWLEEVSIAKASVVFVNSQFTSNVFKNTFKRLKLTPDILYPSLNTQYFDSVQAVSVPMSVREKVCAGNILFLSINRYERKKNLKLAIEAFHKLKSMIEWENARLIMAGGYDSRVIENVEHYNELNNECDKMGLGEKVIFLKSPNDVEKVTLLKMCTCLIYTPENEHFGIVPIEAMYLKKPVIAVNSGGPTESIQDGVTGYLREPNANAFADAMLKFAEDSKLAVKFGEAGRKRVEQLFSFDEFSRRFDDAVRSLAAKKEE